MGKTFAPWPLYAASNLGSLVALLAYPLLIEPLMGISVQGSTWAALYLVYCVIAVLAWRSLGPKVDEENQLDDSPAPTAKDYVRWILLSLAPSMLLLSVTNAITSELGSFPLFWVLPLALYLGSFALAFRTHEEPSYLLQFWPDITLAIFLFCQFVIVTEMQPILYLLYFLICWIVHEQLYLTRPSAKHLTALYLAISLGGWLGGIAVSVVAPMVFSGLTEVPVSLGVIAIALLISAGPPARSWWKQTHIRFTGSRALLTATVALLTVMLLASEGEKGIIDRERSLYGIFTVAERPGEDGLRFRELASGSTAHGKQYIEGPQEDVPMSYYHPVGPNNIALSTRKIGRMAGIGLGAGAVAAITESDETLVFYEINPTSARMAQESFTYLSHAKGDVQIRMGDARLKMVTETDQAPFNAIFIDAFAGDGIPTHLLTREAVAVYLNRLESDGLLVFHISNRYYDLRGVLAAVASDADLVGTSFEADGTESDEPLYDAATTVVLARSVDQLQPMLSKGWRRLNDDPVVVPTQLWTDDYIDVLAPMAAKRANRRAVQ
ncbi:MAG: hypothetical protein GWP91_09280 [Rhodobacterales bacterium]|nr:hypothetical protein [Rhodobacterales bacterium]